MSQPLIAGSIVMGDQSATLSHWSISKGINVTFRVDTSSVVTLDAPTALDCISLVYNGTTTTYAILDGSLDAGSVTIDPEALIPVPYFIGGQPEAKVIRDDDEPYDLPAMGIRFVRRSDFVGPHWGGVFPLVPTSQP